MIVMMAHARDDAPPPSTYALGLPRAVDDLVVRCLAKAPGERPATMAALAAEIDELTARYDALPIAAVAPASATATATSGGGGGGLVPIEPTPDLNAGVVLPVHDDSGQ
jgi:serine/threonine-protein kinase